MTVPRSPLPVDDCDLDDVAADAWARDDSPARFYDRLRQSDRAQARFDATLAEVHERQPARA